MLGKRLLFWLCVALLAIASLEAKPSSEVQAEDNDDPQYDIDVRAGDTEGDDGDEDEDEDADNEICSDDDDDDDDDAETRGFLDKLKKGVKNGAKKVGSGIVKGGKKVWKEGKKAGKKVGSGVLKQGKKMGKGILKGGKKVMKEAGKGAAAAGKKVGKGIIKGSKAVGKQVGKQVAKHGKKIGEVFLTQLAEKGAETALLVLGPMVKEFLHNTATNEFCECPNKKTCACCARIPGFEVGCMQAIACPNTGKVAVVLSYGEKSLTGAHITDENESEQQCVALPGSLKAIEVCITSRGITETEDGYTGCWKIRFEALSLSFVKCLTYTENGAALTNE